MSYVAGMTEPLPPLDITKPVEAAMIIANLRDWLYDLIEIAEKHPLDPADKEHVAVAKEVAESHEEYGDP